MSKEELEKEAREYLAEHSEYSEVFGQTFVAIDTLSAMVDFAEPREKRIAKLEKELEFEKSVNGEFTAIEKLRELEKENAELKAENQKWKDEWQEQVQEATDEGFARILQTTLLNKAKELLKKWLQTSKASGCDNINIVTDTEQFISEVEK